MKYYFEGWFHNKNKLGLDLMVQEGMDVDFQCYKNGEHWDAIPIYNSNNKYDWVISLGQFKSFKGHEGGVIYGPHIMFPEVTEDFASKIFNKKTLFNFLSPWNCDLATDINKNFNAIALPFAVNIEQFQPQKKDGKPVIYFKQVDRQRLNDVLEHLGDDFIVFDYEKRYQESDFADAISKAPYAIWIGRHESQGFAFQETLSSDTPIFVIDVKSCREELNSFWSTYLPEHPLTATAASYFDDSCGLRTYPDRWKEDWDLFLSKDYAPREFIVKNLSAKPCLEIWENKLQGLLS
tara:strand:+ start:3189 stop:4067 length:879 start_codon:yes stop_codon:yes gene_type:complete